MVGRLLAVGSLYPGGCISELAQLLAALQFAAHKHRAQRRKDVDASPYINHPIEVATILATRGGITDLSTLIAAVLHDTIEDTETSPEELEARFGPEVRALVLEVTDDKRLPKGERKRLQIQHAPLRSVKAKIIKLGDKIANVRDVTNSPPEGWSLERRREYLDWTSQVVHGCRGINPGLESYYDQVLGTGRAALEAAQ
jgi:guanosine-3',5'-bis(diphosphate) 3'-pyrophosphohydrolase